MTNSELHDLSSGELHDRAMQKARRHLDVGFMWQVLRSLPAAQAAGGDVGEADHDITHVSALITDVLNTKEDPEALEGLRPLYIDYLSK